MKTRIIKLKINFPDHTSVELINERNDIYESADEGLANFLFQLPNAEESWKPGDQQPTPSIDVAKTEDKFDRFIKFLKNEIKLGFLPKAYNDRLDWYIGEYFTLHSNPEQPEAVKVETKRHKWSYYTDNGNGDYVGRISETCLNCGIKRKYKNPDYWYTDHDGHVTSTAPPCNPNRPESKPQQPDNNQVEPDRDNDKLLELLNEISEGKGRFDHDPMKHARNVIEDMKALAKEAIELLNPTEPEEKP
jgi:hypothetical protein